MPQDQHVNGEVLVDLSGGCDIDTKIAQGGGKGDQ